MLDVGIGLIFWTSIAFLAVLFILTKFAWKPILKSVRERETTIADSLEAAEKAKKEMEKLQADNEKLLQEARVERDSILKEARDTKDKIISEAKDKAGDEADKIIKSAKDSIENEKKAAITELKNQVATLSVEIAEKILREELSSDEKQKAMVNNLVKEMNLN